MTYDLDAATAVVRDIARRGCIIGSERAASTSGGRYTHHNPATGAAHADVPLGGAVEIDAAVRAAHDALPVWQSMAMPERVAVLLRLADLLDAHRDEAAAINALDNGTPVSILDSGPYAASWTRHYAGWVDKLGGEVVPVAAANHFDYVLPEPYGVVAAIVPWNGPMMGMGHKVAPALAAGNTVVCKPPEIAPFGAIRYAELALEAGLPPGVLNVVPGGAVAGDALVRHGGVGKISFTGGVDTARLVMTAATEHMTPLTLELGGKSANIIFPDADLDLACSVAGMLGSVALSGQGCALPTRLFVHHDVYDDVVERVVAIARSATVGNPLDPATLMGPLVTEAACNRVLGVIERARSDGAGILLTGGTRLDGDLAAGYFVAPTVFGEVDDTSDLACREVFGPVLSVMRFHDEDEVVERANRSPYGLAAYVFTRDAARAHRMARRLEVGAVTLNTFPFLSPGAPFGGYKQSGFGREGGRAGIEEFVRRKNVLMGL
ncbi:MAG TPA: aldehyde dehydrogenase family protein [Acidimicrobiia bacterium]